MYCVIHQGDELYVEDAFILVGDTLNLWLDLLMIGYLLGFGSRLFLYVSATF